MAEPASLSSKDETVQAPLPYTARDTGSSSASWPHNLIRSFQLDTLAEPKPRSRKQTTAYLFRSVRTLRLLLVARAGRPTRIGGHQVLRLAENPETGVALWADRSTLGRLIYLPIAVSSRGHRMLNGSIPTGEIMQTLVFPSLVHANTITQSTLPTTSFQHARPSI